MGRKLNGCRNGRQCTCGALAADGGACARSAGSGRAGCAARCPAASAPDNRGRCRAGNPLKGGDDIDGKPLGSAAAGRGVFLLCRYAGLKILHAAVCVMFGFYLASSSLAPDIANITTSLFRLL